MSCKHVGVLACTLALGAALLSGCNTSSSKYCTFDLETDDTVKVELDTSTGMDLTQDDDTFEVVKDGEVMLDGRFVNEHGYAYYSSLVGSDEIDVMEESEKDGNAYFLYEVVGGNGLEDNYVLWIGDSNTGAMMSSLMGEDAAREAFDKLTFSVE